MQLLDTVWELKLLFLCLYHDGCNFTESKCEKGADSSRARSN